MPSIIADIAPRLLFLSASGPPTGGPNICSCTIALWACPVGHQDTVMRGDLKSVDLKASGSSRAGVAAAQRHWEEVVAGRRGGPWISSILESCDTTPRRIVFGPYALQNAYFLREDLFVLWSMRSKNRTSLLYRRRYSSSQWQK